MTSRKILVPEGMTGQAVLDTLLKDLPDYDGPRPQRSTRTVPCACGGDDAAAQTNGDDTWFVLCSTCGAASPEAPNPMLAVHFWEAGSRVAHQAPCGRVLADGVLLAPEEWKQLEALGGNPLRNLERIVAYHLGVIAGLMPLPPEEGGAS